MTGNESERKNLSISRLITFDVLVALISCAVLIESHVSWEIGAILLIIAVMANIAVVLHRKKIERWTSVSLAILYGCGLAGAILSCLLSFTWWKLLVIPFPLVFFLKYINKLKTGGASQA